MCALQPPERVYLIKTKPRQDATTRDRVYENRDARRRKKISYTIIERTCVCVCVENI